MRPIKITLSGVEYVIIKGQFRALMTYEELSGKNYNQVECLKDSIMYMYSHIISSKSMQGNEIPSFSEFVDKLDQEPQVMNIFFQRLNEIADEVKK